MRRKRMRSNRMRRSYATYAESRRWTIIEVVLGLSYATYMWVAGAYWWMAGALLFAQLSIILHKNRRFKDDGH